MGLRKQWLQDGKYVNPRSCPETTCRSRKFLPSRDEALIADWQKIKLQEIDEDKRDAGRVPRTVEVSWWVGQELCIWSVSRLVDCLSITPAIQVELTDDLVHTCVPGDVVVIAGVVKAISCLLYTSPSPRDRG